MGYTLRNRMQNVEWHGNEDLVTHRFTENGFLKKFLGKIET